MSKCHTFDLCAWRTIKEFAGIYNIRGVDYELLRKGSTNKFSLYIQSTFLRLGLNDKSNPYYYTINILGGSKSMRAIRKSVALGFKSQLFFEKIVEATTFPCPCCAGMQLNASNSFCHYLTNEHINRLKSGNYDKIILEKYAENPELFKWLEYSGFQFKFKGRRRLLVSYKLVNGKQHIIDVSNI